MASGLFQMLPGAGALVTGGARIVYGATGRLAVVIVCLADSGDTFKADHEQVVNARGWRAEKAGGDTFIEVRVQAGRLKLRPPT